MITYHRDSAKKCNFTICLPLVILNSVADVYDHTSNTDRRLENQCKPSLCRPVPLSMNSTNRFYSVSYGALNTYIDHIRAMVALCATLWVSAGNLQTKFDKYYSESMCQIWLKIECTWYMSLRHHKNRQTIQFLSIPWNTTISERLKLGHAC